MLFNIDLARAITSNGRYFIRTLGKNIEEGLQSMQKMNRPYVIYHDTDSVAGDTVIKTATGDKKIEDLYDELDGEIKVLSDNSYVKHITNSIESLSFNTKTEETQYKQIKYIMKHKVKKRMFKIKTSIDEVIATEDHSVIVKREGNYISIKPKDIKNTDSLISNENIIKNFEIIDLGIQEQYVYDIEVQDNHNFFGNNILVHNSAYFKIDNFVEQAFKDRPDATITEKTDFCNNFYNKVVDKFVQKTIDDVGEELNVFNKGVVGSEREVISSCLNPQTPIRVSINNKPQTISISAFAKQMGINIRTKTEEILDISDKNIMIPSYNGTKIELKKIINIQKKVTTKKMVKLLSSIGKYIIVTDDHKIATKVNSKIVYKEAKDITEEDDVVSLFNEENKTKLFKECKVQPYEYINERKIVYDIEVEDNHNFFANDILVHNCGIFVAKKKYALRVQDSEGVRYKEPKLKIMGLEIVRSSTPKFVQGKLKGAVDTILDSTEEEIIKYKDSILSEFIAEPLPNIAKVQGVSNLEYDLQASKSIPIGARSVLVFNEYITKNNMIDEFQLIEPGTKIKQIYIKEPNKFNSNIIAWNDDKFVKHIDCVDYQKCFEKYFLSPLEIMTKPLGWNIKRTTETLDEW